jgi:hypothetical protein
MRARRAVSHASALARHACALARHACAVALLAAVPACKPDLGSPASLVIGPRILAVRGVPAEAPPNTPVTWSALAVQPAGTIAAPAIGWSLCLTPKPPAETNAVSSQCLGTPDDAGPAATFMTSIPTDACMLFGPQTPPVKSGQSPIRPRDPDVTGGFYQPVRASLQADDGNDTAFELQRITCPLANAPIDVTRMFTMMYMANQNPTITRVVLDPDGASTILYHGTPPGGPTPVAAGTSTTLELDWPDGNAESYPVWDLASRTLTTHRESMRVSWFATAGAFTLDGSGRGEDEMETFTRNEWKAPETPGPVHMWVVLRDSRGGLDFASVEIQVQ